MTAERHLKRQLRSYLREHQQIRSTSIHEEFTWPAELIPLAQVESFWGFRWLCWQSREGPRFFGIRRLCEQPSFSLTRLAGEGFYVNAMHHLTYESSEDTISLYIIVELESPNAVTVQECAFVFPQEWHVLDAYLLRRNPAPQQPVEAPKIVAKRYRMG